MSRRVRIVSCALVTLCAVTAQAGTAQAGTTEAVGAARPSRAPSLARGGHGLQAVLDEAVRQGSPGALAQTRQGHGRRTLHKGHGRRTLHSGVSDIETHQPPRARMRFRIASITKSFVATVVLQLVAEHRLRLTDSVERWLPGLVEGHGNDGAAITVRMLLNHTSGLYDYTDDPELSERYDRNPSLYLPPRALVEVAVAHHPLFVPGTSWSYSNTNYVILGMIVGTVTGHSYAQEITRRILRPLRLRATYFPGRSTAIRGPHVHGYTLRDGAAPRITDVTRLNTTFAPATGDMISTAGDLDRFDSALLSGRLLPAGLLRRMLTPVPGSEPFPGQPLHQYGLGMIISHLPCGITVYGNGGTIDGFLSGLAATRTGRHALSFVFNGDWIDQPALTTQAYVAEFCRASPYGRRHSHHG